MKKKRRWLWIVLMLGLGVGLGAGIHAALNIAFKRKAIAQLTLDTPKVSIEPNMKQSVEQSVEQSVTAIPLAGPITDRDAEVSGLAWYEDWLIILPQYPERLGNQIFALPKSDILAFLNGETTAALTPKPIALVSPDFASEIAGFEGFEAIAFREEQAFLTIEAESDGSARGYVLTGQLSDDLSELVIQPDLLLESPAQSNSPNKADEAILLTQDAVVSIYEVHGAQVNAMPQAHRFDLALNPLPAVVFPRLEYRVTDATALDEGDRFWVMNYFYPGDRDLTPQSDPLAIRYGRGATHRQQRGVERLVELAYSDRGIHLTRTPPIQLALSSSNRNWEGLARLDDQGFLLMTDKFPETLLGFVEFPLVELP